MNFHVSTEHNVIPFEDLIARKQSEIVQLQEEIQRLMILSHEVKFLIEDADRASWGKPTVIPEEEWDRRSAKLKTELEPLGITFDSQTCWDVLEVR